MRVKLAKWGNSLGVRLPKAAADAADLHEGSEVEVVVEGGEVKLRPPGLLTLDELLAQIQPDQEPPRLEDWSAVEPPWPEDDWSDIAPTDEEMGLGDGDAGSSRS